MKQIFKQVFSIILAGGIGLFAGCAKDGDPGTAGTDGTNGTNGTDGVNGVGFDEAVKYGSIVITLDGTRPDGVDFTKTLTFSFAPSDKKFSGYYEYEDCDGTSFESQVKRYLEMDNNTADNYACSIIDFYDCEGTETDLSLRLKASITFEDDHTYFDIDDTFYATVDDTEDFTLTPAVPSPGSDGSLSYTFSLVNDDNDTGNELTISGTISATVFKEIQLDRIGGKLVQKVSNNHHKSVMLPL